MSESIHVKLSNGNYAIIDVEDYEKVNQYSWDYDPKGYAMTSIYVGNGKTTTLRMHRVITDAPRGMDVDHINGDGLDNRKINLRVVRHGLNGRNRKINANNKSGYKGVGWYKRYEKWYASIRVNGKGIHLGYFSDRLEAAKAYNEAAMKYHGEFARLNDL